MFFSGNLLATVYKCSDEQGKTAYQSSPCVEGKKAVEIHVKTGTTVDLSIKEEEAAEKIKFQDMKAAEIQQAIEKETKRKADAIEQGQLNKQLVQDNPVQYTAFAIPPYQVDSLPALVKRYEARLPEIEKSRRLAAKKALASGECLRVESVELSKKSSPKELVYSVSCSSAKTFYFSEKDLVE